MPKNDVEARAIDAVNSKPRKLRIGIATVIILPTTTVEKLLLEKLKTQQQLGGAAGPQGDPFVTRPAVDIARITANLAMDLSAHSGRFPQIEGPGISKNTVERLWELFDGGYVRPGP